MEENDDCTDVTRNQPLVPLETADTVRPDVMVTVELQTPSGGNIRLCTGYMHDRDPMHLVEGLAAMLNEVYYRHVYPEMSDLEKRARLAARGHEGVLSLVGATIELVKAGFKVGCVTTEAFD